MIPKNTKSVIVFLLKHITEPGYNVNQLARELQISVSNVHKIIKELKEKKMLVIADFKTAIYYSLDLKSPDAVDFCKIVLREQQTKIPPVAKAYAEEIKKFKQSLFTIIYGSILSKKDFRDVDVLFITHKVKEVNDLCNSLIKIRTKPIDPLVRTKQDFIRNVKKKDPVILDIILKGIVVRGEDNFVEALKNGKNQKTV